MAVEEQSSQDSTLIDDDLVAALGFEPVTTIDAPTEDAIPTGGDDVDEPALDEPAPLDDVVEASEVDLVADGAEVVEERASFFDLDSSDTEVEASEEIEAVVVEADAADDFDVVASDLDAVPSITDDDVDSDATAAVGLIDLDSDLVDVADVSDDDAAALGDTALGEPALGETAPEVGDVIDLEVVDLSDAPVEVHELADADSVFADAVFADATPVLDPEVFDGADAHLPTETVEQVGSGLLDLDTAEQTAGAAVAATAATATPTRSRRRLRARKSRRVIRHIDPWSVLTFSVLFHMVVFAALLLSSVLVWNAAIASGMVENVESFIQELGDYETFEINADVMFRAAIVIAGMLTLASSVLVVLLTVVFNLISDLVGGIRVTVIEEETVRVPMDKKRSKA